MPNRKRRSVVSKMGFGRMQLCPVTRHVLAVTENYENTSGSWPWFWLRDLKNTSRGRPFLNNVVSTT